MAGVGRHQLPMAELAAALGGNIRVGLEDNIFLEKGVLAQGSAPLVARAAELCRTAGRRGRDPGAGPRRAPDRARPTRQLGCPPGMPERPGKTFVDSRSLPMVRGDATTKQEAAAKCLCT